MMKRSKYLGIPVIAEGVEKIEWADLLLEYGVIYFKATIFKASD